MPAKSLETLENRRFAALFYLEIEKGGTQNYNNGYLDIELVNDSKKYLLTVFRIKNTKKIVI